MQLIKSNVVKSALVATALTVGLATSGVNPASAQTTITTDPSATLDELNAGAQDLDDIAGLAAAVGMASVVFGAGALIFKRFIYS